MLIDCGECGNEMSDQAEACPKCGAPPPADHWEILSRALNALPGIGLSIFALWFMFRLFSHTSPPTPASPPAPEVTTYLTVEQRNELVAWLRKDGENCDGITKMVPQGAGAYGDVSVIYCDNGAQFYFVVRPNGQRYAKARGPGDVISDAFMRGLKDGLKK